MNYSHITPEAAMVMKMASGDNSPLRQSAVKSSRTPRDGFDNGGGVGMFLWNMALGTRDFPLRRIYGREGKVGGTAGGLHLP